MGCCVAVMQVSIPVTAELMQWRAGELCDSLPPIPIVTPAPVHFSGPPSLQPITPLDVPPTMPPKLIKSAAILQSDATQLHTNGPALGPPTAMLRPTPINPPCGAPAPTLRQLSEPSCAASAAAVAAYRSRHPQLDKPGPLQPGSPFVPPFSPRVHQLAARFQLRASSWGPSPSDEDRDDNPPWSTTKAFSAGPAGSAEQEDHLNACLQRRSGPSTLSRASQPTCQLPRGPAAVQRSPGLIDMFRKCSSGRQASPLSLGPDLDNMLRGSSCLDGAMPPMSFGPVPSSIARVISCPGGQMPSLHFRPEVDSLLSRGISLPDDAVPRLPFGLSLADVLNASCHLDSRPPQLPPLSGLEAPSSLLGRMDNIGICSNHASDDSQQRPLPTSGNPARLADIAADDNAQHDTRDYLARNSRPAAVAIAALSPNARTQRGSGAPARVAGSWETATPGSSSDNGSFESLSYVDPSR